MLWPDPSSQELGYIGRSLLLQGMVPLLGAAVGLDTERRAQFAMEKARSHEVLFKLFSQRKSFLLLRTSALPRLLFLCRTLPPSISLPACTTFDQMVLRTAGSILCLDLDSLKRLSLNYVCP